MRTVTTIAVPLTTDAAGAGTAQTKPLSGRIVEFRTGSAGSALHVGGSADFTLTRLTDGGTVASLSNVAAHQQLAISAGLVTTTGGTTAYATGVGPVIYPGVPIDDHLVVTIAQGALSAAGTVYLTIEGGR